MELDLDNLFVYISFDNALSLVNTDIQNNNEFKESLELIPEELLEIIDLEGLADYLDNIMSSINEQKDKPKADLILAKKIMKYLGRIDIKTAASSEFWNGITLSNNSICNYVTWRWKDYEKYKFFRRNTPIDKNKHKERIKRYVTTSSLSAIRKQTLARVWWAVKLFSESHQKLLWKQQDTVDRILENSFGALDNDGNVNDLISAFIVCYEKMNIEGNFDYNREAKIRSIISWLKLYEDLVFIDNFAKNVITKNVASIFESIINQVDKPKKRHIKKDKKTKILEIKKPDTKFKTEPKIILQTELPTLKESTKAQTTLDVITTEKILGSLSNSWVDLSTLIIKLKIKDKLDARYLEIKLRELTRKGTVVGIKKNSKKYWRLKINLFYP